MSDNQDKSEFTKPEEALIPTQVLLPVSLNKMLRDDPEFGKRATEILKEWASQFGTMKDQTN